jgi:Subtilase family
MTRHMRPRTHGPIRLVGALIAAFACPSELAQASLRQETTDPPAAEGLGRDGGAGTFVPLALDDVLPLPETAVYSVTASGDRLTAPPTGDPNFLGFIAGAHRPPEGERLDPRLLDAIGRLGTDERGSDEVYAFVMFAKRPTPERVAALARFDARPLGFHPYACVKVAVDVARLPELASWEDVRWVGVARTWQKVHPHLTERLAGAAIDEPIRVYINLFESDWNDQSLSEPIPGSRPLEGNPGEGVREGNADLVAYRHQSNGWQQRALERLGATILEYAPELNAFRATITGPQLESIVACDFVQFVEAELQIRPSHDESVPLILADRVRQYYDGGTNSAALVGEIDSGVRITHDALDHIFHAGWDVTGSSGGVFSDTCDHGTHVLGTILGKPPTSQAGHTGIAPGLGYSNTGRVRIVKYLSYVGPPIDDCLGYVPTQLPFALLNTSYVDSSGNTSPKVHVVNNSWSADPSPATWIGSEFLARSFDAEIWDSDILHVAAAGNAGPTAGSMGLPAGAKNVLAIGSVADFETADGDPTTISDFSSRGPCADGRWKPNVVAPGDDITSASGAGNSAYSNKSGTSMASPHVTGVIAQMLDRYSFLRYEPARISSLLMATATTKDNQTIASETNSHLDNYGTGRVDAYRANYTTSQLDWTNWGFDQLPLGYQFADFSVESGATRMVVVMHYVETEASSGANKAILNDYDLYIDQQPVDFNNGNTGDFTAQQSSVDNTEIRIIDNPAAGPWRWKTWPQFAVTNVKMSVTVHIVYGDTTPAMTLAVNSDEQFVKLGDPVTITASVTNPSFIASGVFLDVSGGANSAIIESASTTLDDGIVTDLTDNADNGRDLLLGNIRHGSTRTAQWDVSWNSSGTKAFQVDARSDNAVDISGSASVTVDGSAPGLVGALTSTTHTLNAWSSNPNIAFSWTPANDLYSGLNGYSRLLSTSWIAEPDTLMDLGAVTSWSSTITSSNVGYYFSIRAVDQVGNWGNTSQVGPYKIDLNKPAAATNVVSSTHTPGVWSNENQVLYTWTQAADAHSGIDGYSLLLSSPSASNPPQTKTIEEVTSGSHNLGSSSFPYYINLRAVDNVGNWSDSFVSLGPILIDSVDPSLVTALSSPTHALNTWSKSPNVGVQWVAATDGHSGLAGYSIAVGSPSMVLPDATADIGPVTSHSLLLPSSADTHYFTIRSIDNAGNDDNSFESLGPFKIDTVAPTNPPSVNSPTHGATTWSNDPNVTVAWNGSADAHSGIAGYRYLFTTAFFPPPNPSGALTLGPTTKNLTATLGSGAWYFAIEAEDVATNISGVSVLGQLKVDVDAPTAVSNLTSPSHVVGQTSIDPFVTVDWDPASDSHSGIAGYIVFFDTLATTEPTGPITVPAATTIFTQDLTSTSNKKWFAHVRAVDVAGNLGPTQHLGFFPINVCVPASNSTYGAGKPGTHGVPLLTALDEPVLGTTTTVRIENGLPGALPLLFLGVAQQNIPFDGGALLNNATWIIQIPIGILPDGTLPLIGTLPYDPALCGFSLYHQVMFVDPGAAGYYHLAQTAGLKQTFGY